jgi:hypothetical protein
LTLRCFWSVASLLLQKDLPALLDIFSHLSSTWRFFVWILPFLLAGRWCIGENAQWQTKAAVRLRHCEETAGGTEFPQASRQYRLANNNLMTKRLATNAAVTISSPQRVLATRTNFRQKTTRRLFVSGQKAIQDA